VANYFSAMFAEFVKKQFLRCFHLIFLRDVISVFANRTDKTNFNSMFSFFRHKMYYTLFEAGIK